MGRNLIARVSKTCDNRQADSGKIKPGSETVKNPDPDSFRPQNQRSRPQNPQQTRPQPPVERGWADKADSRPPLRGPGGWGGDWYVWHAPDGLRARVATGLGCVQAGAQKLGVTEASYASAIIGVVDRPLFRRGGTTQPKGLISTAWASISTSFDEVPFTLENVLFPETGDFLTQTDPHDHGIRFDGIVPPRRRFG